MTRALVALLLGAMAGVANAAPVDPDALDGVAAMIARENGYAILTVSGEYWGVIVNYGEVTCEFGHTAPIPVNEIRDWFPSSIYAKNGDIWKYELAGGEVQWINYGPLPCLGPVEKSTQNFGELKSLFR